MDHYSSRTRTIQTRAFTVSSQHEGQFETAAVSITDADASHDEEYQSLFQNKGIRKASEVLQCVDEEFQRWLLNPNFQAGNCNDLASLCSSTAVVSIGGADGSELMALMSALGSYHGVLVEISPCAAAEARARGVGVVIEDDVMDAASNVVSQLLDWQEEGEISTILISCQSVLHELPSRSSTFTKEAFLQDYLVPLMNAGLRVMFYAREPCPPHNWSNVTDTIAVRLVGLNKDDVAAVATYIAQELNITTSVDFTYISNDSTRVILPVILAQEVLFKMLYWKDIEHFQYEMGEQLTSFQPENWSRSLNNINMHTKFRYLTTNHFSNLYHQEELCLGEAVAVNVRNDAPLETPKCFVQLFATFAMPSAISTM